MKPIIRKNFLFFLLITFLTACTTSTDNQDQAAVSKKPAKKVKTVKVKEIDYQQKIFATGKLSLEEEAKLSFKTGGIIKKVYVNEGQSVRKGQLLAELSMEEIKAQTQQANIGKEQSKIQVENAKLALQLAERDYKNVSGLYQDSVATLEQLENVEVQLDNARNQLAAAEKGLEFSAQNIDIANFNLKFSRIVAPSNGTILKKLAETNELVGPGTPLFLFGSNDKAQVIKVNLTDKDIIFVELGNEAVINFDAYPRHDFKGIVREMASMADPYTSTYEVEIEVRPDGKKLLSGFIGQVSINTDNRALLLEIPVDALVNADEKKGDVFVVEAGKAIKTKVGIYKIYDENILIDKGLNKEDEVIISGVGYLEHDDPVMISQN